MGDTRIGIIYPADGVLDLEFWQFAPPGVSLHLTRCRIPEGPVGVKLAEALVDDPDVDSGASTFRPIGAAAVAYACTSGSFVKGHAGANAMIARMEKAGGAPATTTSTAIEAACKALGVRKVAVAAPYVAELSRRLGTFLEEAGIGVTGVEAMGLESGIGEVAVEDVVALGRRTDHPDAEALVISCTNLRTLEAIPALEQALGKPVVTANQATIWHACRLAGVPAHAEGVGRLWRAGAARAA